MLSTVLISLVFSQANPVDTIVQRHLDRGLLGAGVAVVKDGKIVHLKTYGRGATPRNDGHYRLASITKQFTAGVIVKLVRENKLAYEDSLGTLMPDTPKPWHAVTVRQLLTHTSGIPSYTDADGLMTVIVNPTKPDGIWQLVKDSKMDFEPGKGWKYNNTAYCLLGNIIERTTKQDYYSALGKYVLKPAGMNQTGPESRYKPVDSFDDKGKPSFPINMDWPYSAGALVSTLGDMVKWDIALRSTKLFRDQEKALMFNPDPTARRYKQDYGFGWGAEYANGKVYSYSHTGGIPGFSNKIERTANGVTVIVLANHEYDGRESLSTQLVEAFDPKPRPLAIVDTLPELTTKHRVMLENLLQGKVTEADFSAEFLQKVPAAVLISTSKQLAAMGSLTELTLLKSEGENDVSRSYRVKFGDTVMTLNIMVSAGVISRMMIN